MNEWKVTREASCAETGLQERSCTVCGERETQIIAKTEDHAFGGWYVKYQTSCRAGGMEERICMKCGKKETKQIKALEHTLVKDEEVKATCTQRGQQYFHYTEQALGHDFTEDYIIDEPATCTKNGFKSKHCRNEGCSAREGVTVIPMTGHSWSEWKTERQPACTMPGYEARTCHYCGKRETKPINSLGGHIFDTEYTVDIPVTCTTVGWESIHCKREGCTETRKSRAIMYTGHKYERIAVIKEASCEEDGKETVECSVCHERRTRTLPASTAHNFGEVVEQYQNACLGYLNYRECRDCGKKEYLESPAGKGHNWSTSDYMTAVCLDCHIHAPYWTNQWAATHCQTEPPYDLLPEYKAAGENYRPRVAWGVWFRADLTMSVGFQGAKYADTHMVIDADYKYVMTAPEPRSGYKFVGWANAGTGHIITTEKTYGFGWQYERMLIEAKYEPEP